MSGSGYSQIEGGSINEASNSSGFDEALVGQREGKDGDPHPPVEGVSSSSARCIANLANTIVGSGMLALPHAFSEAGFVLGSIFLCLFATASAFGLHLLSCCALHLGKPCSFRRVTSVALPDTVGWIVDATVALKCFGVATSYLIVVGDSLPDVATGLDPDVSPFWTNRHLWVTVGLAIIAPLCFFESMDKLAFTSMLSLGFVAFLTGMVLLFALDPDMNACSGDDDTPCHGEKEMVVMDMDTVRVLTVFIFGFTCQQNVFAITNELKDPTPPRVNSVILRAVGLALTVYILVAVAGYGTFGDSVESDILTNYGTGGITTTARFFVALLVCFSYPLQCHPSRMCITSIVRLLVPSASEEGQARIWHIGITAVFLAASYLIALVVTDLGVILAIVGATGSTMVSYVLPGLCYFRLFPEPHIKRNLALVQFGLGCVIIPLALTFIFYE